MIADHAWGADPVSPETVVGWRVWQVVEHASGLSLAAWSSTSVIWPQRRRAEARCLAISSDEHLAPQPRCRCGLHAFGARARAEDALVSAMGPGPMVLGRVSLWGRVVEHAGGWRAQFGYPYDIALVGGPPQLARALGDAYAVDAEVLSMADLLSSVRATRGREYRRRMGSQLAA